MRFERFDKKKAGPIDSISDSGKYQLINKQYKIQAKKEAIRKNKVIIKYNRLEDRLKRKYELSGEEKKALNKGRGMKLKGNELILFNTARKKQEKFSDKLLKMRRERSIALQNKDVQDRVKKKKKLISKRDKKKNGIFSKWRKMKEGEKYDSYEYPKRYYK